MWLKYAFYILSLVWSSLYLNAAVEKSIIIGLNQARKEVYESQKFFTLCAKVLRTTVDSYYKTVSIGYIDEDGKAKGDEDFMIFSYRFVFSRSRPVFCFNISLIDDQEYENSESFMVKLTSEDYDIALHPQFSNITINDNDHIALGWEKTSYTVEEQEEIARTYVTLEGSLSKDTIITLGIAVKEGSARKGQDFLFPDYMLINFTKGIKVRGIHVKLIKNLTFEEDKDFLIQIIKKPTHRISIHPLTTTVVIKDFNAVIEKQPKSLCEGLKNLINTSSSMCFSDKIFGMYCSAIVCATEELSLGLFFRSCHYDGYLSLMDKTYNNKIILSENFPSYPSPLRRISYTFKKQIGWIYFTSRVVKIHDLYYYMISLNASELGIFLPLTAIPMICYLHEDSSYNYDTVRRLRGVTAAATLIITIFIALSSIVLIYVFVFRKRKLREQPMLDISQRPCLGSVPNIDQSNDLSQINQNMETMSTPGGRRKSSDKTRRESIKTQSDNNSNKSEVDPSKDKEVGMSQIQSKKQSSIKTEIEKSSGKSLVDDSSQKESIHSRRQSIIKAQNKKSNGKSLVNHSSDKEAGTSPAHDRRDSSGKTKTDKSSVKSGSEKEVAEVNHADTKKNTSEKSHSNESSKKELIDHSSRDKKTVNLIGAKRKQSVPEAQLDESRNKPEIDSHVHVEKNGNSDSSKKPNKKPENR